MLEKIKQFSINKKSLIVLFSVIALYLLITVPVFFDHNHQMKNLEPYPDSLLFSLSARNLSLGKGLGLVTNWGEVGFWVPPLYSLYLSAFYIFSSYPTTFYLANLLLGVSTIIVIYSIIKKTTNNYLSIVAGLSIYLSHLVVFWLPTLAMTENLSLLLFSILLWGLLEKNIKRKLLSITLASTCLLLVRFSVLPILLVSTIILLIQLKSFLKKHLKKVALIVIFFTSFTLFLNNINLVKTIEETMINALSSSEFFNLKFISFNLSNYLKALLMHGGNFLWLKIGTTSWPIVLIFFHYLYKSKNKERKILLTSLFLSLFPLQLLFYSFDSRYIIYSLIIFSLGGAWAINTIKNKKAIFFIFIALLINIFYQKDLARQLVGDNLLGRSTAWQYEAVMHFNEKLTENQMLITALPPFLVDAYQTTNYRTLPFSENQEFLQKKMYVWGDDINYNDLFETYRNWLKDGKEIYISNSYITHQQSVADKFEKYKKEFKLRLISESCLNACNIYKLEL